MSISSMTKWAEIALHDFVQMPVRHQRLLINELEAISHGKADRLMVQMPPGSAKSTYTSILLPAWWLARHPHDFIIAASHTASLATYFGRRARSVIAERAGPLGYGIANGDRASSHWFTSAGGEYYSIGTRGAIIGRRADIAIIDDPIKSQADADSIVHRDHLWNWYRSDLIPRLKPKARIVLIMTRWHQDDLCGRLLTQSPDEWRRLELPACAGDDDRLQRSIAEPLWPDWEDTQALFRRRASVGERAWSAQFQQSPRPETGTLFKIASLKFVDTTPPTAVGRIVRAWDLAATETTGANDPDWTVGVKLMVDETGRFTVLDVVRLRGSSREVEDAIALSARTDGRSVSIGVPQDPGQAGKSQVGYLARILAGYHVQSSKETGSKIIRATPVSSQVEAGNVTLVRGNWNHAFIDELCDFPYGRKDDQVDALSHAFGMLVETTAPTWRTSVSHMAR